VKVGDKVYLACDVVDCDLRCGYRGDTVTILYTFNREPGDGQSWDYCVCHQSDRRDAFFVTKDELTEVKP
jgi:hypothetical protein